MSDEKKKTKQENRWVTCFHIIRGQNRADGEDWLKISNKDRRQNNKDRK